MIRMKLSADSEHIELTLSTGEIMEAYSMSDISDELFNGMSDEARVQVLRFFVRKNEHLIQQLRNYLEGNK